MKPRDQRRDEKYHFYYDVYEPDDEKWKDKANCRGLDPNLFFPERGRYPAWIENEICGPCEVRQNCLDYSLKYSLRFGIFGGVSERNRRSIRASIKRGDYETPWAS